MDQNSLLTTDQREYLRGEKKGVTESNKSTTEARIRKRVASGLEDFALVEENIGKIGGGNLDRVLMEYAQGDSPNEMPNVQREGWRFDEPGNAIVPVLTFLMRVSSTFNYSAMDWQAWIKRAYETANPEGYANVGLSTIPRLDGDHLEAIFRGDGDTNRNRDDLRDVELKALLDHGRIDMNEYVEAGGPVQIV